MTSGRTDMAISAVNSSVGEHSALSAIALAKSIARCYPRVSFVV